MARFPDGESLLEAQTRVIGALERLRRTHPDDTILAVSHADILKAAVAHYLGLHLDLFQRLVISPASVTVLRFAAPGTLAWNISMTQACCPVCGRTAENSVNDVAPIVV
ncbi:MAG: histidine phosphatase family protein [Anaerolineae bacterium]|nr:histidine phosphatase family protein [Anaerolineae bacterium]